MPDVEVIPIDALTPDPENARAHTERNLTIIAESLQEVGAARSIVIDEHGRVLAGNATTQAAREAGIERVVVVEGDGRTLVAVRRSGLSKRQKRRLALADNRSAEFAQWDTSRLLTFDASDLEGLFTEAEIGAFDVQATDAPALPSGGASGFTQMTFTITEAQAEVIKRALAKAKADGHDVDPEGINENSNGNALAHICEGFCGG